MTKFNVRIRRPAQRSPVASEAVPSGVTYEGAPGFARDTRSELFLLAITNITGEDTFYERAGQRDDRYTALVHEVAVADPAWTEAFLRWLRLGGNMRSAAIAGAAEAVRARLATAAGAGAQGDGRNRRMVTSVLQRGDEPGELLAYWTSRYGRTVPKPVKRGIADAVRRLYTQRSLLRYDTASHAFRFADVLDITHPSPDPGKPWQGDLFRYALDRRHGHDNGVPESLAMIRANRQWRAAVADNAAMLFDPDTLAGAGVSWEDALSAAGPHVEAGKLWESLAPSMGMLALARNLRNMDRAGVSDAVASEICARFADAEQVATSRMFPFRWLAAYRHAPSLRWAYALEKALDASLSQVPRLAGRTLILVDVSGSMNTPAAGALSDMSRIDAAAVFGAALALRTEATLVAFDTTATAVPVERGASLLKLVESIPRRGGGTNTAQAVRQSYAGHDRVVIITDEQAARDAAGTVSTAVPSHVPIYTWNLAGYRFGHTTSGTATRHTFGGLTDAAFRLVPLIEAGGAGDWEGIFGTPDHPAATD